MSTCLQTLSIYCPSKREKVWCKPEMGRICLQNKSYTFRNVLVAAERHNFYHFQFAQHFSQFLYHLASAVVYECLQTRRHLVCKLLLTVAIWQKTCTSKEAFGAALPPLCMQPLTNWLVNTHISGLWWMRAEPFFSFTLLPGYHVCSKLQ